MDDNTSLLYRGEASCTLISESTLYDLHIDQILTAVTEGYDGFHLERYYSERPKNRSDAEFRAAVAIDLRNDGIRERVESFHIDVTQVKRYLGNADAIRETPFKGKWRLDAAAEYVKTVTSLCGLMKENVKSEGLERFLAWLRIYAESEEFKSLRAETAALSESVERVSYALNVDIGSNIVYIEADTGTGDVCADFIHAFDRYDLRYIKRDITAFGDINMNVLEQKIISVIGAEHPDLLNALSSFCSRFEGFMHDKILTFEREALFFISYIEFVKKLESKGFPFSPPRFADSRRLRIAGGFDASLALLKDSANQVVESDFEIFEGEKSFLLTGPNQGGKTTFSRMLGQVLLLSALGLPVPCREAEVLWTNGIETHFNAEENPSGDSGRLREELARLESILTTISNKSVVILNELFSSTTAYDALEMGAHVLKMFEEKECVCLYITHIFELAKTAGAISLIAEITEGRTPTYRIKRGPTGGSAFANRLLAKHRLRAADIKERNHAAIAALQ